MTQETEQQNKKAFQIGLIAGILLLVAGVTGVAAWEQIQTWVYSAFADIGGNIVLSVAFTILMFVAALGGIIVIIGALMFTKEKVLLGKILIFLGVGVGLIGFIIGLIVTIGTFSPFSLINFSLGFVGIILSLVSRRTAVAPK